MKWKRRIIIAIAVTMVLGWALYLVFGPKLVESAYHQESIDFLNNAISGKGKHSVSYYQVLVFGHIKKLTVYAFILIAFLVLPVELHLSLVSVIFLFFILEGGYRVYDFYLESKYEGDTYGREVLWSYDPLLGWRNTPNTQEYQVNKLNRIKALCKTNSMGIRDHEYPLNKPRGTRRVLLVGDSGVAGFEVEKEFTVDSVLENLLRAHGSYDVINGGTRGYGTDQTYLNLKERLHRYQPDLVIYVFFINDPENNITIHRSYRKFAKPYYVEDEVGDLKLMGVPVPETERFEPFNRWTLSDKQIEKFYNRNLQRQEDWINARRAEILSRRTDIKSLIKADLGKINKFVWKLKFSEWLEVKVRRLERVERLFVSWNLLEPQFGEDPGEKPAYVLDYQWRITQKILKKMAGFVQNDLGAQFLVYEFTNNGVHDQPTRLKSVCDQMRLTYFNSFKDFFEGSDNGRSKKYHWAYDEHWNEAGHKLAAENLYWYLRNSGWVE